MDRDTLERVRRDMSDRTNWRSQIELDDIIGLCDFAEQRSAITKNRHVL